MTITKKDFCQTVLRAEIMALLHDVGKLDQFFILCGAGQKDYKDLLKQNGVTDKDMLKRRANLTAVHTTEFLGDRIFDVSNELKQLRERLAESLDNCLSAMPENRFNTLNSLAKAHHGYTVKAEASDYLAILAMYADTADSLYTKGSDTSNINRQENNIVITSPFGRELRELPSEKGKSIDQQIANEANAFYKALTDCLADWQNWQDATLITKRKELRKILEEHGAKHLAETRLPNNDVSLWQHTASVAGIFKALLAGYLLSDNWQNLLRKDELAHINQKLSFFALRWDREALFKRAMRSFEIVGRQKALKKFADQISSFISTDLCLGNEIYRDNDGICFLMPALPDNLNAINADANPNTDSKLFEQLLAELKAEIERLINGKIFQGDLPYKVYTCDCSLNFDSFLAFWHNIGDNKLEWSGPEEPLWQKEWEKTRYNQICPRCGLRPIPDQQKIGGNSDNSCKICNDFATKGHNYLESIADNSKSSTSNKFLSFEDYDSARVALIQGVFSLAPLFNYGQYSLWEHLLTPFKDKKEVLDKWQQLLKLSGEDDNLRKYFASLLGQAKTFCTENDGWLSDEAITQDLASRIKFFVQKMVFSGEPLSNYTDEQIVERMILWGARQHPAPSRLGQVWQELKEFNYWALNPKANDSDAVRPIPLTSDLNSFQILVPAKDAWSTLKAIYDEYLERFGKVRHVLPLHLSANIFKSKSPLYIAMDAAKRFRTLADKWQDKNLDKNHGQAQAQTWTLKNRSINGEYTQLIWQIPDGREVTWQVPHNLPNRNANGNFKKDLYRTWFYKVGQSLPVHLDNLNNGEQYYIYPSTFDYEVLDASSRRYDIHYHTENGQRSHYMMRTPGSRPYPLEILASWQEANFITEAGKPGNIFSAGESGKTQRKNAITLLSDLHLKWGSWENMQDTNTASYKMSANILAVTMQKQEAKDALLPLAVDGSFFDVCEWIDFISK